MNHHCLTSEQRNMLALTLDATREEVEFAEDRVADIAEAHLGLASGAIRGIAGMVGLRVLSERIKNTMMRAYRPGENTQQAKLAEELRKLAEKERAMLLGLHDRHSVETVTPKDLDEHEERQRPTGTAEAVAAFAGMRPSKLDAAREDPKMAGIRKTVADLTAPGMRCFICGGRIVEAPTPTGFAHADLADDYALKEHLAARRRDPHASAAARQPAYRESGIDYGGIHQIAGPPLPRTETRLSWDQCDNPRCNHEHSDDTGIPGVALPGGAMFVPIFTGGKEVGQALCGWAFDCGLELALRNGCSPGWLHFGDRGFNFYVRGESRIADLDDAKQAALARIWGMTFNGLTTQTVAEGCEVARLRNWYTHSWCAPLTEVPK